MTFEAIDPATVRITIDKPISETLFLAKVASYAGGMIVCKKAIEEKGMTGSRRIPSEPVPFCSNPMNPAENRPGRESQVFSGTPTLKEVAIRYMAAVNSRELGFQTGELHIIEGLKEDKWIEKIAALPDVTVKSFGPCETQVFHFNLTKPPLMTFASGRRLLRDLP